MIKDNDNILDGDITNSDIEQSELLSDFYKIDCQIKCNSSSLNTSCGVFQSKHFRGRLLINATASH